MHSFTIHPPVWVEPTIFSPLQGWRSRSLNMGYLCFRRVVLVVRVLVRALGVLPKLGANRPHMNALLNIHLS